MAEEPATLFFTGTAGAGKTSLVRAVYEWMKETGLDSARVNLDPGSDEGPEEWEVDIREWVRLTDVMTEYGLGPNGAQVAAADLIALKVFEVKQAIAELRTDYILVDTPGQVELFAFRESSRAIVDALGGERGLMMFLFDPTLARTASGFVSLQLLSANVEFRFRLPMVNVLAKSDLLKPELLEEVLRWGDEPDVLEAAVRSEYPAPEVELSAEMFRALAALGPQTALLPTSSGQRTGIEAVYRAAQHALAGGEDVEPSHAPPEAG
jgi:GPN-loop GTPase